jgi:hypothetical protein
MKKLVITAATAALLSACQATNPPLTAPPRPPQPKIDYQTVTETADGLSVSFDPRVDILFIIDDSGSMRAHQQNLSRNINKFVESIAQVKTIDFHIGYTVVHDSTRYGTAVPPVCPPGSDAPGRVNYLDPGSLNELQGPAAPKDGRRYVTKDDDFRAVLSATLDPQQNPKLVKELIDDPSKCQYGAQEEESFTPLLGALDNPVILNGPNKGFRRDGALFVAVIVSDAKDAAVSQGRLTPETVAVRIARATGEGKYGQKRFRVFAVAIKPGSRQDQKNVSYKGQSCEADPAFALSSYQDPRGTHYRWPSNHVIGEDENPLATLAKLTEDPGGADQVLSICDKNYGETLARFGTQIKQDALTDIEIDLPRRPQITDDPAKKLRVFLGDIELDSSLWRFDLNNLRVVVYGQKIDWNKYANSKVRVQFTPVDDSRSTSKPLLGGG